jgi:transposase
MSVPAFDSDVVKEIPIDTVRVGNNLRHAGGRPVKMTVKRFLQICDWIQQGRSNTVACRAEGVDYTTFRAHIRKNKRWTYRYELADKIRDEFLRDVHLTNIAHHAKENWQASAWLLERKFPSAYALHFKDRDSDNLERRLQAEIPAEVLAENRALMLEMAREDEAKAAAKMATELPVVEQSA